MPTPYTERFDFREHSLADPPHLTSPSHPQATEGFFSALFRMRQHIHAFEWDPGKSILDKVRSITVHDRPRCVVLVPTKGYDERLLPR